MVQKLVLTIFQTFLKNVPSESLSIFNRSQIAILRISEEVLLQWKIMVSVRVISDKSLIMPRYFKWNRFVLNRFAWRVIASHNRNRTQKGNFSTRQCSYSYSCHYKKVISRFRNRIIIHLIENLWRILARKTYDQEKPPIEHIVKLEKRIKSTWADFWDETLNKSVDSVLIRLIDAMKNKGKPNKYYTQR